MPLPAHKNASPNNANPFLLFNACVTQHTASSDPGWHYFAGRMEREEAEKLLRYKTPADYLVK